MITKEIKEMAEKSNAAQTERREDLENDLSRLESMREAWGAQYLMERVLDVMHGEIERQRMQYGHMPYVKTDCKKFEGKLKRIANAIKENGLDMEEINTRSGKWLPRNPALDYTNKFALPQRQVAQPHETH
jgi:hypothetical protein